MSSGESLFIKIDSLKDGLNALFSQYKIEKSLKLNWFRMEVCSFHFKFDDMVPRKGEIISSSFFGDVEYI